MQCSVVLSVTLVWEPHKKKLFFYLAVVFKLLRINCFEGTNDKLSTVEVYIRGPWELWLNVQLRLLAGANLFED